LIRISITAAAFEAIAAMLPLGRRAVFGEGTPAMASQGSELGLTGIYELREG
jgi:hypothetical protein